MSNEVKLNFQQAIYGSVGSEKDKEKAVLYMKKQQELSALQMKFSKDFPSSGNILIGSGNLNSKIVIVSDEPMDSVQRNFYNKIMKVSGYATHRVFLTVFKKTKELGHEINKNMLLSELTTIKPFIVLCILEKAENLFSSISEKHKIIEEFGYSWLVTFGINEVLTAPERAQKKMKLTMLSDFKQLNSYY